MARRLLTYICIDTSGSMKGEPIEAVNVGLQSLLSALRQNPYALESVHLSIYTFDLEVKNVLPVTPLEDVIIPTITCPDSGATFMGRMLEKVVEAVKHDRILSTKEQKGDWRPILIFLTDGKPSDLYTYKQTLSAIKALNFSSIVACAAGPKADPTLLLELTDTVVALDTMDSNSFSQFFQWVSATVNQSSVSAGAASSNSLPPPPDQVNVFI